MIIYEVFKKSEDISYIGMYYEREDLIVIFKTEDEAKKFIEGENDLFISTVEIEDTTKMKFL